MNAAVLANVDVDEEHVERDCRYLIRNAQCLV